MTGRCGEPRMTANLTEADIIALGAVHLIEAVAAKDHEHVDAILELWARQPELARILGRVSLPEERRQQYCMRAQPPGEGLTAGLSPGGDRCQALA